MNKPQEQQQFKKKLNPMDVWAIAFGCIIGWGAFINPGEKFLPNSGVVGTAIAIAIGAIIMIVISFSYAYMIRKHPKAGGEFIFAKQCFGRIPAYICGWFLIAAYLSNVPLNSTALGLVINGLAPGALQHVHLYTIAENPIFLGEVLVSCGVLILFAVINMLGTKKAGIVQTVLAVLLGATVLILVIAAIASPVTSWKNIGPLWGYFKTPDHPKAGATGIMSAILVTLAIAPWAFVGFETIPQAAEEFKFSFKKVIFIMVIAIIFGTFVYIANNTITALVLENWPEEAAQGKWVLLIAAQKILGKVLGSIIVGTAVLSAILSGIMGFYMASSRLIFSMGREGYLPKFFGTVDKKHSVPQYAILFCLAISLIGPFLGRNALTWFVDMASIGTSIGFGFTCLAAFITMQKDKDGSIWMKILTLAGLAFAALFIVIQLVPIGELHANFTVPSYIIFGVWIVLGAGFFLWQELSKKKKAQEQSVTLEEENQELEPPKENVEQ